MAKRTKTIRELKSRLGIRSRKTVSKSAIISDQDADSLASNNSTLRQHLKDATFRRIFQSDPELRKEYEKNPNKSYKQAIKSNKYIELDTKAYTSTSAIERITARGKLALERKIYGLGGGIGEAFRQAKRATTLSEARGIKKDYFFRGIANSIERNFGIAGEAWSQRIRQNISKIKSDDPDKAFQSARETFSTIADQITRIEQSLNKQMREFNTIINRIDQNSQRNIKNISANNDNIKSAIQSEVSFIKSSIGDQSQEIRTLRTTISSIDKRLIKEDNRIDRLIAEIEAVRERMTISSNSSEINQRAPGNRNNIRGGAPTLYSGFPGLLPLFNPKNLLKKTGGVIKNATGRLLTTASGVATSAAAGSTAAKVARANLLSRAGTTASRVGTFALRSAPHLARLGPYGLAAAGTIAAGYGAYKLYEGAIDQKNEKDKARAEGINPETHDPVGHSTEIAKEVAQSGGWGSRAARNALDMPTRDKEMAIKSSKKATEGDPRISGGDIPKKKKQPVRHSRGVLGNNQNIAEQIEKARIDQEKSKFMQFGQLPTGFEFIKGHMGRLGSPAAVAASGAMPLSGDFSLDGSAFQNIQRTSIYSSGGREGGFGFAGSSFDPEYRTDSKTAQELREWLGNRGATDYASVSDGNIRQDAKGNLNRQDFYNYTLQQFANSPLNGFVPKDGKQFGIDGTPESWARFAMRIASQESSFNVNTTNMSDPGGSLGIYQFGQHYGINAENWKDPKAQTKAFITYAQRWVVDGGGYISPDQSIKGVKRYNGRGGFDAAFASVGKRHIDHPRHFKIAEQLSAGSPKINPSGEKGLNQVEPTGLRTLGLMGDNVRNTVTREQPTGKIVPISSDPNDPIGSLKNSPRLEPMKTSRLFSGADDRYKSPFNWSLTEGARGEFGPLGSNMTTITMQSGKKLYVNKSVAEDAKGFIDELEARGYDIKSLGGYSFRRNVNNPSRWSTHATGGTFDINPAQNPNKRQNTDMPEGVKYLAMKYGFAQLGDDKMHFERVSPENRALYARRLLESGVLKKDDPRVQEYIKRGYLDQKYIDSLPDKSQPNTPEGIHKLKSQEQNSLISSTPLKDRAFTAYARPNKEDDNLKTIELEKNIDKSSTKKEQSSTMVPKMVPKNNLFNNYKKLSPFGIKDSYQEQRKDLFHKNKIGVREDLIHKAPIMEPKGEPLNKTSLGNTITPEGIEQMSPQQEIADPPAILKMEEQSKTSNPGVIPEPTIVDKPVESLKDSTEKDIQAQKDAELEQIATSSHESRLEQSESVPARTEQKTSTQPRESSSTGSSSWTPPNRHGAETRGPSAGSGGKGNQGRCFL